LELAQGNSGAKVISLRMEGLRSEAIFRTLVLSLGSILLFATVRELAIEALNLF
jgi:hypothetical protein